MRSSTLCSTILPRRGGLFFTEFLLHSLSFPNCSVIVLGSLLASQYRPMVPGTTEALCEGIPPAQAPMLRVLATDPAPPQAKVDCEPLESSNFCDGAAAARMA